jgi:hypothetical protein
MARPRICAAAPLTGGERQARHRGRIRDAVARVDAARRVIDRADQAVRLCGDVAIVAAWLELRCILVGDKRD